MSAPAPPTVVVALEPDETPDRELLRAGGATAIRVRPAFPPRPLPAALPPGLRLFAVLPDMPRLLRDVAERGAPAAAIARLRAGGPRGAVRLARAALGHPAGLARQDFSALAPILMQLDRAGIGRVRLDAVVLAAPLTDLLLAARHVACLAHLVRWARRHVAAQVGFETLNLGHLLPRLDAWGVAPDFVIGPLNARGFRMKPSPSATLAAVRRSPIRVLASDVSAGRADAVATGIAFAHAHGAAGVVVTIDELAAAYAPSP